MVVLERNKVGILHKIFDCIVLRWFLQVQGAVYFSAANNFLNYACNTCHLLPVLYLTRWVARVFLLFKMPLPDSAGSYGTAVSFSAGVCIP